MQFEQLPSTAVTCQYEIPHTGNSVDLCPKQVLEGSLQFYLESGGDEETEKRSILGLAYQCQSSVLSPRSHHLPHVDFLILQPQFAHLSHFRKLRSLLYSRQLQDYTLSLASQQDEGTDGLTCRRGRDGEGYPCEGARCQLIEVVQVELSSQGVATVQSEFRLGEDGQQILSDESPLHDGLRKCDLLRWLDGRVVGVPQKETVVGSTHLHGETVPTGGALETFDVLHDVYFPSLLHQTATRVKYDAVGPIQHHCVAQQDTTLRLPVHEGLLRTYQLEWGEGGSQDGDLILVDEEEFLGVWVQMGVGGVDVVLLDEVQGGEGEQEYLLCLLSHYVVLPVQTDHVVHTTDIIIPIPSPTTAALLYSIPSYHPSPPSPSPFPPLSLPFPSPFPFLSFMQAARSLLIEQIGLSESHKYYPFITPKIYRHNKFLMQDSKQSKPYFIQLINAADKSLKNKFKFVLAVGKVAELRDELRLKLISKKELEADSEITVKDNDDFELASDDECKDVVPDCKVKVYLKAKVAIPLPLAPVPAVVIAPVIAVPAVNEKQLIVKSSLLDLTGFTIPMIGADIKHKLLVRCPQVPKSGLIEVPVADTVTSFYDLSQTITRSLGLSPDLKAILYNSKGQPFFYNLDLMHMPLPKLDFSEQMWVIFTNSPSTIDFPVAKPEPIGLPCKISLLRGTDKFNLMVDLENSLDSLRSHIFEVLKYHPNNQILKFGGKQLDNLTQSLKAYGVVSDSIIEVSFKLSGNLVPCTFADKFYYKDVKHVREQSEEGIAELRSTLLTLASHLSEDDKLKVVTFLRAWTDNLPLAYNLKCLFHNNFVSQVHRIAIEEGLLVAVADYINGCTPDLDKITWKECFGKFRNFIGFVLEGALKIALNEELRAEAKCVEIQRNCHFTLGAIRDPRIIKLDSGGLVLVDREAFEEQILKGFTYPDLKAPKKEHLIALPGLEEFYMQFLANQIDNTGTNALFWSGYKPERPVIALPALGAVDLYNKSLESYPDLKVHQPLEVKNKSSTYLLIKTKEGKLRVFVSKNKDIAKPYNLFDVLTGNEEAVNLDLMGANVRSENVEEAIDLSNLKPVITRPPKEAIAVLFDVSGSMGSQFFNEPDLKRIGAVKSFFEAFAFRTIAYNLQHVVSLFFFDHSVENQCGFTEAIYDFNRLIAKAAPRGSTLMFDAVVTAADALKKFQLAYPDCLLRIVALTDGQDTGSKHSVEGTTRLLIENKIVIDSFAVGANCEGLKTLSIASGGKCYLTRNLEESLKLFEQETVLSVRARKIDESIHKLSVEERILKAKLLPFDLPSTVHEFKMPQSQGGGISAKDMVKKLQSEGEVKKMSGNNSLKRIAKEIQNYNDNPHPFVAIFPCANINLWKILLLGPKETPYENGLFLLYVQFPGDYPFKAPEVRFITPIYHCNMNSQGRICHSVFDRNYSPALTFRQIIDCVYGLILTPEPEDPLDNVIASFYLSDYQTYLKNAKQFTKDKASQPTESIVDELFGKIVDDCERKQKEKEIEEWVTLAKSFN